MNDYRLVFEDLMGLHSTEFMPYEKAKEIYDSKLLEKDLVTIWCDLEYHNPNEYKDRKIILQFTRKTRYEWGKLVILPNMR